MMLWLITPDPHQLPLIPGPHPRAPVFREQAAPLCRSPPLWLVPTHSCLPCPVTDGFLRPLALQAGHPFHFRNAHSAYSHARLKQEAPIFLLFLDCVWQLGRQFPFSLQFSERLLLVLFEHTYASCYGTFLCNSEKER